MNGNGNGNGNGKSAEPQMMSIYVLPTEEGLPPRAVFLTEVAPGVQMPVGGVAYTDDAWRDQNGNAVDDELAEAITEHAESLGVELTKEDD